MAKILLLILAMASGVLAEDCDLIPGPLEWEVVIVNASDQPARFYVEALDLAGTRTVAANSRVSLHSYNYGHWRVVLLKFADEAALRQLRQDLTDMIRSGGRDLEELKGIEAHLEDIRHQVAFSPSTGPSCSGTFTYENRVVGTDPSPPALVTSVRVGQEWVMRC
jgi:hypothetical protein